LDHQKTARVEQLRTAFARAGVAVEVPADIHVALWEKCMLVVPFGGLGAVTRAPIGVLRTVPETRHLLERGMEEIYHVARARGIPLADDMVTQSMALTDTVTPSGTSSLQRDIVAGKRSELEAWTGAVVRLGAEAGVATPVHTFLYASLLQWNCVRAARWSSLPERPASRKPNNRLQATANSVRSYLAPAVCRA
jgi:2-dehydropantoate 2-reductase